MMDEEWLNALPDILKTITLIVAIIVVVCSGNIGEDKEYYIKDKDDRDGGL